VRPKFDGGIMSAVAQDSLRWNKGDAFYFRRDGSLGNLREIKEVVRLTTGAREAVDTSG
jgi:hypothetical protein